MHQTDAIKAALHALSQRGEIRADDPAAYELRIALLELDQQRLMSDLARTGAQWNDTASELASAYRTIARLETDLARTSDAMDDEIARPRCAERWAAAWKQAALHQRRMEREIEAAVERRDERIRVQDATITDLKAHRDRLMAEVAARPEPVPFEPSSPGENIKPKAARRVTRSTGEHRCVCGKVFATKQALGSHRRTHTSEPVPEPQPEPVPDHVAAAWANELYRCPQCQSLAFAQALHGDMCVKCAAERKAA